VAGGIDLVVFTARAWHMQRCKQVSSSSAAKGHGVAVAHLQLKGLVMVHQPYIASLFYSCRGTGGSREGWERDRGSRSMGAPGAAEE
jgi:hypothetical protein